MPNDDRLIWTGGGAGPLTVCVQIGDLGRGSIILERYRDGNSDIVGTSGGVSVDRYCFEIPENELPEGPDGILSLEVRVAAATPGNGEMRVYLQVEQPNGPLTPVDGFGDPIDVGPAGYELQPRLRSDTPGEWEFDIWFA